MPVIVPAQTGGGIVFTTPAVLIETALKYIGVVGFGRSASAAEIKDGLTILNAMLDTWGVLRENINVRTLESFVLTINKYVYQIGLGAADFNTVRPVRVEQAYYRDSNNTDFPLDIISDMDYNNIPIKGIVGTPESLFYKPDYPLGSIYLDFAPSKAYTLFLNSWKPFIKIADANDPASMSYPDGYEAAILFNLAEALCPPNKKPCPPYVEKQAIISMQAVQTAYGEPLVVTDWDTAVSRGTQKGSFFNMNGGR